MSWQALSLHMIAHVIALVERGLSNKRVRRIIDQTGRNSKTLHVESLKRILKTCAQSPQHTVLQASRTVAIAQVQGCAHRCEPASVMLNLNRDDLSALDDHEVFLDLEHDPQVMSMELYSR